MSYTVEDYVKEHTREHLQTLSVDDRLALAGLSPDVVLQRFSLDEVLQHWSTEKIEAYLAKLKKHPAKRCYPSDLTSDLVS